MLHSVVAKAELEVWLKIQLHQRVHPAFHVVDVVHGHLFPGLLVFVLDGPWETDQSGSAPCHTWLQTDAIPWF